MGGEIWPRDSKQRHRSDEVLIPGVRIDGVNDFYYDSEGSESLYELDEGGELAENEVMTAMGRMKLASVAHPENNLRDMAIKLRIEICKAIEKFAGEVMPTREDIESPYFVLESNVICLEDIKQFMKIIEVEKELEDSYMCGIIGGLSRLDADQQFYDRILNLVIKFCRLLKLPAGVMHRAAGYTELYFSDKSAQQVPDTQLVLGIIALANHNNNKNRSANLNYFNLSYGIGLTIFPPDIQNSERCINSVVGENSNFPTTLRWLEIFLYGLTDFTLDMLKWAKHACCYILDINLRNADLRKHRPSLRCAAAIYFIRYIIKFHCDCCGANVCEHRLLALWPKIMIQLTGYRDNNGFRKVAYEYGKSLISINGICIPAFQNKEVTPIYSGFFNIYLQKQHDRIAIEPKMCNFNQNDLDKLRALANVDE